MKTKLHYVFSLALIFVGFSVSGQNSYFTKVSEPNGLNILKLEDQKLPRKFESYNIDLEGLRNVLTNFQQVGDSFSNLVLEFPDLEGKTQKYQIFEASVMHPDLQARYPEIRSYAGYGIDNSSYLRFSISPYNGFNGIVLGNKIAVIFESDRQNIDLVRVFNKSDHHRTSDFECSTLDYVNTLNIDPENRIFSADATLHTFDLAMSVTGEYSAYHGATLGSVNAAINTTVTNVNAIFENDFNVTLEIIAGNDALVYLDGTSDPYDSVDDSNYNQELADNLDLLLNDNDYDIGHLMGGIGGNGNAGCIGCVCENGEVITNNHKGSGYTTNTVPIGPSFDVDYVAHEIGHQFGGRHTFTHSSEGIGIAQMEPGSGSTIMGYAGITGATDVQSNSDPYFYAISIQQITAHVASRSCDVETATGNNVPIANAGGDLILPIGTPFKLTGSGSDGDVGDVLTYCWEQFDEDDGTGGGFPDETSTNSDRPLFRSYIPTTSPTRTFPELQSLLNTGVNGSTWEKVPTVTRSADFRLTVRDNSPNIIGGGANDFDDMIVNWDDTYGPFAVTSQSTPNSIVWTPLTSETITWDVLNTDGLAGAANVNILLSLDGGLTYSETLATNTPNDGTESITVPNVEAPYCRIMIEPTGNQFFAINTADFAIGNYTYQSTESCTDYIFNAGISVPENASTYSGYFGTIPDSGVISDLDINVDITHIDNSDLYYAWIHPSQASGFQALASGLCPGAVDVDLTFDDEGSAIDCLSTNNGDNVLPQDPLSFADGLDSAGDWVFLITDVNVGDGNTATWNSVTFSICVGGIEPVLEVNDFVDFENMFSIYPNPNNGEFEIKFNATYTGELKIQVFDLRGRSIYNDTFSSSPSFNEIINIGNVPSGMYLVNVSDGKRRSTRKIIIN